MAFRLRNRFQLGRGTVVPGGERGSMDCGPRSWQMMVNFLTRGDRLPRIRELRRRAGVPGAQTTNVAHGNRAVESYDHLLHRTPLTYTIRTLISEVKVALRAGRVVHLCIDYGKWNDVMPRTGDPHFRHGHSVIVQGQRTHGDEIQVRLFDPLEDGRRPEIPDSPYGRWVPRDKLLSAAQSFARARGRCWAGVGGGGKLRR